MRWVGFCSSLTEEEKTFPGKPIQVFEAIAQRHRGKSQGSDLFPAE